MDTDSFIFYIKTEDIYVGISKDLEPRFDTWDFELERPLPKGKQKVIELMKDELGRKIMKRFAAMRAKAYSYLTNNDEDKRAKSTKSES